MLKLRNTKFMAAMAAAVMGLSLSAPTSANIQDKINSPLPEGRGL